MKIKLIIITLLAYALSAQAQTDATILDMAAAFKKNDAKTLTKLLPQAQGHPLESWAAYWELRTRLESISAASTADVDRFLKRYANTYAEDRLRADWLLELGKRRDWSAFAAYYPAYRMRDDKDIRCYAMYADTLRASNLGTPASAALAFEIEQLWGSQKEVRTGCGFVAQTLIDVGKMSPLVAWRKSFSTKNIDNAKPAPDWNAAQLDWFYGAQGRALAQNLDTDALKTYAKVQNMAHLSDDMLAGWARAALRVQDWPLVHRVIDAMSDDAKRHWIDWRSAPLKFPMLASALAAPLGGASSSPSTSNDAASYVASAVSAAAAPGLRRALYAIQIGLRAEGVREWNYETNLARGPMSDDERLAAAALACQAQVWDRCINTSERTKNVVNLAQRFPTPYKAAIVQAAKAQGLEPAYVFGLIRQESRFVFDIRSSVGAAGLMQVMPATAKGVAKNIGMANYGAHNIHEPDVNLALGAAYLKQMLLDFGGNPALAAAAYNAGPHRVRRWLAAMPLAASVNAPEADLPLAIWIENIPFNETRDYVKKVLASTAQYRQLLTP